MKLIEGKKYNVLGEMLIIQANVIVSVDKHVTVVAENWNQVIYFMFRYRTQLHMKKPKMERLLSRLKLEIHVLRKLK